VTFERVIFEGATFEAEDFWLFQRLLEADPNITQPQSALERNGTRGISQQAAKEVEWRFQALF